jgi:predicted methyltransferase
MKTYHFAHWTRALTVRWMCALALAGVAGAAAAQTPAEVLDQAIAGVHRTPAFKARDPYRHPSETLLFFGLRPDMHVAEIWPGAGWYAEILAPVLRERGRYYAAHFVVDDRTAAQYRDSRAGFIAKLARESAIYGEPVVTSLRAPDRLDIAPPGSLDLVLTFRNVHNWVSEGGHEVEMFRAFHTALKPGGILGVVEHRAAPGTSLPEMLRTGYMTESFVIGVAEKAGFRLDARSEINANPKDTRDHPAGVWTLPPTYRLGETDREKYAAIGESDRMTLRFVRR